MIYNISDLKDLEKTVILLQEKIKRGVFYLKGELGVGKTQFVRTWLNLLGYNQAVPSPTWNIINEYEIKEVNVIHADLYRINDREELLYLDVDLWQQRADLIFIEWAERGENLIPDADFILIFKLENEVRTLEIIPQNKDFT